MGLIGRAKRGLFVWYATRFIKSGLEGKEGEFVKEKLQFIVGARSAIALLVAVSEALARQAGLDSGPVFGILYAIMGAIGADVTVAKAEFGIDPVVLASSAWAIKVAVQRLIARYTKAPAPEPVI